MPKLTEIDQPRSLFERFVYWRTRRQFGKVLTPLKVIYARKPRLGLLAQLISRTADHGLSLEPTLRHLIGVHVARLNGCTFCEDLNLAQAAQRRIGRERFQALASYQHSALFSAPEKAALRFCEEATQNRRVRTDTFDALQAHFDETQIVELTWLNAAENYFNLQAAVLGIGSDHLEPQAGGSTP